MRTRWLSLSLLALALSPFAQAQLVNSTFWSEGGYDAKQRALATAYANALPVLINPLIGMTSKDTVVISNKFSAKNVATGRSLGSGTCSITMTFDKVIIGATSSDYFVHVRKLPVRTKGCTLEEISEDPEVRDFVNQFNLTGDESQVVMKVERAIPSIENALADVMSYTVAGRNVNWTYDESGDGNVYKESGTINLGARDISCVEGRYNMLDKGSFQDFIFIDENTEVEAAGTYETSVTATSVCGAVRPVIGPKAGSDILSTINFDGISLIGGDAEDLEEALPQVPAPFVIPSP